MSFRYSTQFNVLNPAQDNVGSIALQDKTCSLVVSRKLSPVIYQKLSKQFRLTQYVANMNMSDHDAAFVDCRGVEISSPYETVCEQQNTLPDVTVVLVDANSYLPPPDSENPEAENEAKNNDSRIARSTLELTTESELDSTILTLRMHARFRQKNQSANHPTNSSVSSSANKPASEVVSHNRLDTAFAHDNAFTMLQAFVQHTTDWIVVKDLNHRFVMVSDRFLKSQNKSAEDVIGKNDLEIGTSPELVLGNEEKSWKGYWNLDKEVIDSGKPSFTERMDIHENALEQLREQVAKVPIKNAAGKIIGLMVCITQIHTSKFNGEKVTEFASSCDTKLSPIIDILDSERSKAVAISQKSQSAFRRKNNFIATASHDLRQPLQAIGLFIESLEQQISNENQLATLKKMKQSSNALSDLLNSILDISKLDADAVVASKTHFCVAPLLKSLEDEFKTEATRKSLNLHINTTNSFVFTDSLLLVRILRNLLSNAVKYTQAGNVNLTTEIDNDSLLIHIKDSGPGIPEEQYLAIFDEYSQLEDQHSQPNFGMGLGLSIVKRLTNLLDLNISLDSKLNEGTRFTLTVPLGTETNNITEHKKTNDFIPIESYKLLVVEDNPVVLDATQEMLTSMNCEVYPAKDIPEALEIIKELDDLPDLLLVDYQLANGVTGDTAINEICEAAKENLPAIIVTGNTNSHVFREASKAAYRVLNKPVNPDGLLKTIDSAVKDHREHRLDS